MSNLREEWLSTGATQAHLYRTLQGLYGSLAISRSAFQEAMAGKSGCEDRTQKQILRAAAEVKRQAFIEKYGAQGV